MYSFWNYKNRKQFCNLLGNFISRKSGQKCCVYGQNGKPLNKEVVEKFLKNLTINYEDVNKNNTLSEFEINRKQINWEPNEEYTKLKRLFYFRNVFLLTDFIKEIYNIDYISNLQQIPNISVSNQEIFKIELHTPALKGLSFRDLQLAMAINSLNFDKYKLTAIKNEQNYRRELRLITIEDERKKNLSDSISEGSRFKNKYDALVYENSNPIRTEINNSINNANDIPTYPSEKSECSNPEGCACAKAKNNKYEL
jgi:pterin-4a-carbinolamine dehydratase